MGWFRRSPRVGLVLAALGCGLVPLGAFAAAGAVGAVALVAVGVAAWMAASAWLRPVAEVTGGLRTLAGGRPEVRSGVPDLGALVQAFEELADDLARRDRTRLEWMRDTTHELRSRLTALRSDVEAMQDGVTVPGPASLELLHGQVMWLSRLSDSLQTLARLDAGQAMVAVVPVAPLDILDDVAHTMRPLFAARDIELDMPPLPTKSWVMLGEPSHLWQLFTGLLENSLRCTDIGGQTVIGFDSSAELLIIRVEDTAPGVSASALTGLFLRQGLSVCAGIVKAHGGRISAARSGLGGLKIEVSFPCRWQKTPS